MCVCVPVSTHDTVQLLYPPGPTCGSTENPAKVDPKGTVYGLASMATDTVTFSAAQAIDRIATATATTPKGPDMVTPQPRSQSGLVRVISCTPSLPQ